MALIELNKLTKIHHSGDSDVAVLKDITFQIEEGEFVAITGPSGSGKSSLMHIIGCLDRLSGGTYKLNGSDISALSGDALAALRCHTFGFIFQRYNLLNNESALDNVEIPAIYAGKPLDERVERAHQLLATLDLKERSAQFPKQMSGGQQQRVAIARALMNGGYIILADEPTGALDSESGSTVLNLLQQLNDEGHTVIIVTHDPDIAAKAKRIITLKDGHIVNDTGTVSNANAISSLAASKDTSNDGDRFDIDVMSEAIRIALSSLQTNRFRSLLAMLGIIIGIASVVCMMAIGNGTKEDILASLKKMGTNLLVVRSGAPKIRGGGGRNLTLHDATAISKLPFVAHSVPEISREATVRFHDHAYITTVTGSTQDYPEAHDWPEESGSFFTEEDYTRYVPVAVLGKTVVKNLFPDYIAPIGQHILIGNTPFQVIGIMSSKGASPGGTDLDDTVWVPLSTGFARIFGGKSNVGTIYVEVEHPDEIDEVEKDVAKLLLERHGAVDYKVRSLKAIMENAAQTSNNLTWLLAAIALISLVVGGIGVMNIMLVSVSERTREIGIRMANGARSYDIKLQFLTEAVVICTVGGILGILLGIVMALIAKALGFTVSFTWMPILISFGSSFVSGVLFGYIPAKNASRLDPIVALSME